MVLFFMSLVVLHYLAKWPILPQNKTFPFGLVLPYVCLDSGILEPLLVHIRVWLEVLLGISLRFGFCSVIFSRASKSIIKCYFLSMFLLSSSI